ncbi:SC16B protein, partial [Atractosteus spatula]|nr:SC16B protein [Atractosteus spatula]
MQDHRAGRHASSPLPRAAIAPGYCSTPIPRGSYSTERPPDRQVYDYPPYSSLPWAPRGDFGYYDHGYHQWYHPHTGGEKKGNQQPRMAVIFFSLRVPSSYDQRYRNPQQDYSTPGNPHHPNGDVVQENRERFGEVKLNPSSSTSLLLPQFSPGGSGSLARSRALGLSSSGYELSQYIADGTEHSDLLPRSLWGDSHTDGADVPQLSAPLKFSLPHVRAGFGPAGQLVRVSPSLPTQGEPALVEIHSLESFSTLTGLSSGGERDRSRINEHLASPPQVILMDTPEQQEARLFPGPLAREDLHKVDAITFAQNRADTCLKDKALQDQTSAALLWNLLVLLCRQNGRIVGSDIAELLLKDSRAPGRCAGVAGGPGSDSLIDLSEGPPPAPPSDAADLLTGEPVRGAESREQALQKYTGLLLRGQRKEALEAAMASGLWGHALLLASKMDNRSYTTVLNRFTGSLAVNDPLQTLFQLLSRRTPAVSTCCGSERWGDWRPHLAVILSNPPGDPTLHRQAVTTMGDTLAARGLMHAAHFCYLMAQVPFGVYTVKSEKLVLLGSNHCLPFLQFARSSAIQSTEVLEYSRLLGDPSGFISPFQVYKFLYACRLLDCGLAPQAFHYCEVIGKALLRQETLHVVLVEEVIKLADRLKASGPQFHAGGTEQLTEDPRWLVELRHRYGLQQMGSYGDCDKYQPPADETTSAWEDNGIDTGDLQSCLFDTSRANDLFPANRDGCDLELLPGLMTAEAHEHSPAELLPQMRSSTPATPGLLPRRLQNMHTGSLQRPLCPEARITTAVSKTPPIHRIPSWIPAILGNSLTVRIAQGGDGIPVPLIDTNDTLTSGCCERRRGDGAVIFLPFFFFLFSKSSKRGWFSWFKSKPTSRVEPAAQVKGDRGADAAGEVQRLFLFHQDASAPLTAPPPGGSGAAFPPPASAGVNPFSRQADSSSEDVRTGYFDTAAVRVVGLVHRIPPGMRELGSGSPTVLPSPRSLVGPPAPSSLLASTRAVLKTNTNRVTPHTRGCPSWTEHCVLPPADRSRDFETRHRTRAGSGPTAAFRVSGCRSSQDPQKSRSAHSPVEKSIAPQLSAPCDASGLEPRAGGPVRWAPADQWLLRRCLGSVRGMRRFCSFVRGSCDLVDDHLLCVCVCVCVGEELLAFWLRVEQLLLVDEPDESQRHRYRARLAVLKAMHLCEGSSVAATCRVTADALLQISSSALSGSVRREVLAQMQGRALLRLRCYWLPRFLTHCRLSLAWLPESSGLLREYELGAAAGAAPARPDLPPGPAALGQPEGCGGGPYSSRRTRQRLWRAAGHSDSGGSRRLEDGDFSGPQWVPMEDQGVAEGEAGGRAGQVLSSRACVLPSRPARSGWLLAAEHSGKPDEYTRPLPAFEALASTERVSADTPVCRLPAIPAAPPPRGDCRASETLHSALSADGLAGGPFRSFLESRSLVPELLRLGLWQDMDSFLHLLLKLQDGSGHTLRQVTAERIVGKYLSQDSGQRPLLEKDTARQLRRLLPAGQVTPWIHVARNEIAKVLCSSYDAFLDDEDAQFLSLVVTHHLSSDGELDQAALPPGGPNSPELQVRRMREALALCQACSFSGEPGLLSEDTWDLMALEDVRRGGSVHLNYRKTSVLDLPFEELALRHPRLAAQELSKNYRLFYTRKPFLASTKSKPVAASVFLKKTNLTFMKKGNSIVRRPSLRPRSLADVLRNPVNLDFFKRFLKAYNAHGALLFYQEVEKLRSVSKPRVLQARIVSIVNKFFSRHSDVEGFLQCDASIVSQIPKMRRVPLDVLFMAQDLVMKSLEARWFQQYQDTFPPCSSTVSDTCDRAAVLKSKLKRVWSIFSRYIKTVCKFRSAMKDIPTRSEFEHYLRHNFRDFSESMCGTELVSAHDAAGEGDSSHLRKRVVNSKLIAAGFLVNDLSFCLETERFRSLADAGVVMASAGMYGESDQAVLQSKADMIIRLFLRSEIAPRLRINISEVQREAILQSFSQGKVDRGLFHSAFITIFPNLVFCWKK